MITDALASLFALLDTEEDDFAALVQRFGIDPAKDLQNCDLSNVDFGRLTADVLNLNGSNIHGANLSQVRCKKILRVGDPVAVPDEPEDNVWEKIFTAIYRYQNSDWLLRQIISTFQESSAPILAFYDSAAEQDILTKRLCAHYGDASHVQAGFSLHSLGPNLLWFYSKGSRGQFRLDPTSLDKAFFEALQNTSDDIGIYPLRSNQAALSRIRQCIRSNTYDQMRAEFARSLQKELSVTYTGGLVSVAGGVVLFSGFPPISKRLYRDIREAVPGKLSLIFLCSSNLEPFYTQDKGMPWRRDAVPAFSVGEPLAADEDIGRLSRRVSIASNGSVTLNESAQRWMEQFVGEPLTKLKSKLVERIRWASPNPKPQPIMKTIIL